MWLLLSLLSLSAHAEDLYAAGPVTALRFRDGNETTLSVAAGDKVAVVLRDDAMVRVRVGQDFGWIPASLLSATEPGKDGAASGFTFPGVAAPGALVPGQAAPGESTPEAPPPTP